MTVRPKVGALGCAHHHQLNEQFAQADRAHAVMDACRAKPDLRHLEAVAFRTEQVFGGHADVVKGQFADRRDLILATHPAQPPHQANAGRVHRHQDAGMAAGAVGVRIGHAHHDQEAALRMRGTGDEPFSAVDDVVVAIAPHRRCDVGRIRRSDIGLGHAEGGARLCLQQRPQPARFLLRRRAVLQRDHVGHVGRLAVEHFRRPEQPAHDFRQRRIFEI